MNHTDLYELFEVRTKVFLDNEYGVIINLKDHELSTFIRWDTPKEDDIEDWSSMWGTFVDAGGKILSKDYQFRYINDDGSIKNAD